MTRGTIIRAERAHAINGVEGRMFATIQDGPETFANQKWSTSKEYTEDGKRYRITPELRFDDNPVNGHNTFAITADIRIAAGGHWREDSGGCLHEEIAKRFPELAHLIRWHLTSTNGPMHYVANAAYHASNRDHSGRLAGEPLSFEHGVRFNEVPITHRLKKSFFDFVKAAHGGRTFAVRAIPHKGGPSETYKFGPQYTLDGYPAEWHSCPFRDKTAADEFAAALNTCRAEFVTIPTTFSEGKARDLDAARSCAVWPEATDEELSVPTEELKAKLQARLSGLIAAFRADIEAAGFLWSPASK